MLEILTKFQTNYQPTDIEMIDVHDVTQRLPSEIKGTPTIFADGRYFHGDDAFERISSVEIGSRARPSINSASSRGMQQSDTIETINEQPNTQHTNNQNISVPDQSQEALDSMNSMFEEECIMPRKG